MDLQLIGEECLDVYIYGRCHRLSPEAPVPVFTPTDTKTCLGMAGNVLANLKALGGQAALIKQGAIIRKTRYVEETRNHCLLRVDEDPADIVPFDGPFDYDVPLAVSDYNKGFLTCSWFQRRTAHGGWPPPSFLDTKKPLGDWCLGFTFIKINEYEYLASKDYIAAHKDELDEKLIVTRGAEGCTYQGRSYPIDKVTVLDVTGAGDTFFAGFIYRYLQCGNADRSIRFANHCARQVVQKRGTSVIDPGSLDWS